MVQLHEFLSVPNISSRDMVEVSENARFSLAIDKMRFLAPHISAKETPLLTLTNFTGKHTGTGCADPGDEDPNERVFTIDMLLHSKFAFLFDGSINMDLLKNGLYGVRLTGASFTRRTHNLQSRFLPTDKAVFLLTNDSPFLTCHFTSRLNTITRHTRSPCHCLVLVQAVEPAVDAPRNAYGYRTTRRVRIVQDGVRDECHLVLWDAYTAMADLLEVGDWIGVHDAFVHDGCFTGSKVGPVSIEYGGCTTLFCIVSDRTRKKSETMSQRLSVAKAVEDLPVDDNVSLALGAALSSKAGSKCSFAGKP
ncbi:hypothetical protein BC830DRAFT_6631 [Chytriomyces sp. MP71]|nr:hypothetical protein BC830DRAFT_6631 [Chytriomyces sp. MP71]